MAFCSRVRASTRFWPRIVVAGSIHRRNWFLQTQSIGKLLIEATSIVGAIPSRLDRLRIGEELARAAKGEIVAFLVPVEYMSPEKFGRAVAGDFGLKLEAFASEPDALAWLSQVASPYRN